VLGLTGGVGMGKSTCSQLLLERGIPVVDTDELARQLVEPGAPALAEVQKTFGADLIDAQGRLRRGELARRAFADPATRQQLEAILHPRIRRLWREQVEQRRPEGHRFFVVAIPLLFETQAETDVDTTLCIACSAATQQARLAPRGWSSQQIQQRIQAQLPIEEKMGRADFVIWTEAGLDVHASQLDRILAALG